MPDDYVGPLRRTTAQNQCVGPLRSQHYVDRPQGPACDIGAYEAPPYPLYYVTCLRPVPLHPVQREMPVVRAAIRAEIGQRQVGHLHEIMPGAQRGDRSLHLRAVGQRVEGASLAQRPLHEGLPFSGGPVTVSYTHLT